MVNVVNVRRVADAIEKHEIEDLGFNMEYFWSEYSEDKSGHNCGTTACIGGWAAALKYPDNYEERPWIDDGLCTDDVATEFMGLERTSAEELMLGDGVEKRATPAQAVRTLRHLADTYERTGQVEVRWDFDDTPSTQVPS